VTRALPPAGPAQPGPGRVVPVSYLVGSTDPAVLAEVVARVAARRVGGDLLVAELTAEQVAYLRREYAGRAVIEPDVPPGPFST
jgi:hypothetical protein